MWPEDHKGKRIQLRGGEYLGGFSPGNAKSAELALSSSIKDRRFQGGKSNAVTPSRGAGSRGLQPCCQLRSRSNTHFIGVFGDTPADDQQLPCSVQWESRQDHPQTLESWPQTPTVSGLETAHAFCAMPLVLLWHHMIP